MGIFYYMYKEFKRIFEAHGYTVNKADGWCPTATLCTIQGDRKDLYKLVKILFDTEDYKLFFNDQVFKWGFSDLSSYGRHTNRLTII